MSHKINLKKEQGSKNVEFVANEKKQVCTYSVNVRNRHSESIKRNISFSNIP